MADSEEEQTNEIVIGFFAIAVAVGLSCCCGACCCCFCCSLCRRRTNGETHQHLDPATAKVQVDGHDVAVEHLRRRKELLTAYVLWLLAGVFGAHHFYLERVVNGFVVVWSGNFCMVGWFMDALMLPTYVQIANRCTTDSSVSDGTFRRAFVRLPLSIALWLCTLGALYVVTPRMLHNFGLVDLDQGIAGTTQNPYDILGVPRGSSYEESMAAFGEQTRRYATCRGVSDADCKVKRQDLEKVLDFLEGASWQRGDEEEDPDSEDKPRRRRRQRLRDRGGMSAAWADWTDFLDAEWKELPKAFRKLRRNDSEERETETPKGQWRPRPADEPRSGGGEKRARKRERPASSAPSPTTTRKGRKGSSGGSSGGKRQAGKRRSGPEL